MKALINLNGRREVVTVNLSYWSGTKNGHFYRITWADGKQAEYNANEFSSFIYVMN